MTDMKRAASFAPATKPMVRHSLTVVALLALVSGAGRGIPARAQGPQDQGSVELSEDARAQIASVLREKAALTHDQGKIDSRLLHAKRRVTGETSVLTTNVVLPRSRSGKVQLELRAEVTERLLDSLRALGVAVVAAQARHRSVLVDADLMQIEQIAALPDVRLDTP